MREVLLVERDRLLAAAAQPAQRLGAGEDDPRAVGELARLAELVVGVGVVARLVERPALVEDALGGRVVGGLVAGLVRRLELLERRVRVRVAHAVAGREVLLVERDRLLAAAAQPAQRLRARERDAGAVGELAGAREEGVGVPVLAALVGAAAEREQLAPDVLLVLVLLHRLGDRGLGLGVGDAGRLQRRVCALELAHRARGDRAVDAVDDELGLDLVEQVEVHLQRGHRGACRAHGERAVLGRRRLARDERGRGAVAGVALDAEQALDGQRRSAQRGRRRERGDDVLRGLGRGSSAACSRMGGNLPDARHAVKRLGS